MTQVPLQNNNKLIWPHLRQLNNDIETKSDEWSSEAIDRTQHGLSLIVSRLNNVRNSRLAINKLTPDILYIIFTLIVDCPTPTTTALDISHVCHHWREFTLDWPVLWAFINLNNSLAITELFMKRSKNSRLTLMWSTPINSPIALEKAPSNPYLITHARFILPRLRSLRIYTTQSNFISLYCVIQDSILLPLQLLSIVIYLAGSDEDKLTPPPLQSIIDNSCLQEVTLFGLDLPRLKISRPHNRLTYFTLKYPPTPPALPQLLSFLSDCYCLKTLILTNDDYVPDGGEKEFAPLTLPSLRGIQRLDLPNLTELELEAQGPASYYYIWQFAWCIRATGTLSSFKLIYYLGFPEPSDETTIGTSSFQIFGAVPPGTFSHFSNYQFLFITGNKEGDDLTIRGQPSVNDNFHLNKLYGGDLPDMHPFQLDCSGLSSPFSYSAVLELLSVMPHIRHLSIRRYAWKVLTLPNMDMPRMFPHLRTVELIDCDTEAFNTLKSLPANLRVKRLILTGCIISFDILISMVISIGAEILELVECKEIDADEGPGEMISALQYLGVEAVWKNSDNPDARHD